MKGVWCRISLKIARVLTLTLCRNRFNGLAACSMVTDLDYAITATLKTKAA